jgi:hypothetical protein
VILILSVLVALSPAESYAQGDSLQNGSDSVLNVQIKFHYYSLIEKAEDGSSFVYDGADGYGPKLANGFVTTLNCQTYGKRDGWDYWSGSLMWTLKLKEDVHVKGDVQIKAYISSKFEGFGFFDGGGYGMGLVDLDENRNDVTAFPVEGSGGLGNPFNESPELYALNVAVNHIFKSGHYIGFFVGAGATIKGYTFNVHFDSPTTPSGVTLPIEDEPKTFGFDAVGEGSTYKIVAESDSYLSNFGFNQLEKQISFSASGIRGTAGYCSVWIPRTLFESPFKILIDSQQTTPTETENSTHSCIYFTYTNDVNVIKIAGKTSARLDHITIFPSSKVLQVGSNQEFHAQGYDQNNSPMSIITFAWAVAGGIGSVNPATGQTTIFTGSNAGSGSVSATATYMGETKSGSASVTVATVPTPDVTPTPDATPPIASTLNDPSDITPNSLRLTWTANTDANFARYDIYQSSAAGILGTNIATITDRLVTYHTVTELSENTTHFFTVRVVNRAGLFSDSVQVIGITTKSAGAESTSIPPVWRIVGGCGAIALVLTIAITILVLRKRKSK